MGGVLVVMAVTVHDGTMILLYPKSQKTQQLVTSDPKICLMTGGGPWATGWFSDVFMNVLEPRGNAKKKRLLFRDVLKDFINSIGF